MARSTSGKACDACRRRKLKCSRTLSDCTQSASLGDRCLRCIQTDLRCTFDDERQKRGPRTGKRLQALRLAQNASESPSETVVVSHEELQQPRESGDSVSGSSSTGMCSPHSQPDIPVANDLICTEDQYLDQTGSAVNPLGGLNPGFGFILETDYVPTEQDLLTNMTPQLMVQPISGFPLQEDILRSELSLYFSQAYVAYPILHHATIMKNVHEGLHRSDREFGTLMLSIVILNEACKVRLSPEHDPSVMEFLVKTIENLRMDSDGYHFAEDPSMDTVIVSLCLFIAYNVTHKHNRAFCYLTEAIGLFDLVSEPSNPIERMRQKRLTYILYITESATVSIYGSHRKRMISRRPSYPLETFCSLSWYSQNIEPQDGMGYTPEDEIILQDRQALELLLLMTRLHLATSVAEVAKITVDDKLMWSVTKPFENGPSDLPTLRYDTQMADVAITRQWKLAGLWWKEMSCRPAIMSSEGAIESTIEMIATTTITWSKTLQKGYLRIVGLGKLVDLIDSMFNISTTLGKLGDCTGLMRHLMQTVAETDYDRYFAPRLSVMELCIGDVPRSLVSDIGFEDVTYDTNVL